MATYLIQNGVNKRSTTWTDKGSSSSPSAEWNISGKLRAGCYVGLVVPNYATLITGWNAKYDASGYAHLYITGYFSGADTCYFSVGSFSGSHTGSIQKTASETSATYKFDIGSLSSSVKSNLQTFMYGQRYWRVNGTTYGYISNMWLTKDYTITYNANGGSGEPSAQTLEEGSRTLSSTTPTRSGYSFLGWSTSSSATTATYAAGGTISLSSNVLLYAVWKAELSTVSASNGTIGTSQNITITQQGSSYNYNHTLKYSVTGNNGTASGTIVTGKTGSSQTITQAWTPPESILAKVTNAKTCACVITCETYSGTTLLGSKSCSITLTIPSSYAPTLSGSVTRTSGTYPSGFSNWVKGKTTPYFSYSATPKNNATITKWEFTVNGYTASYNSSATSYAITGVAVTSGTLKAKVTDSRGYTAEATTSVTVTDYTVPTITNLVMARSDSGGTITAQGEYLKVTATIAVTSLSSTNTKTWKIQYKEQSSSTWLDADSGTLSSYSVSFSWTSASDIMDESKSYDTRIVITDYYGDVTGSSTVSTALSIMDFKANGLGVAFGKVHEEADKVIEIAPDWQIKQDGVPILPMVVESVDTDNITAPAGNYKAFNINTAKTGYTPIGIVGWYLDNATDSGIFNTYCFTIRLYLNAQNNVYWLVRNTSTTTDAKIKARAYILYVKNPTT